MQLVTRYLETHYRVWKANYVTYIITLDIECSVAKANNADFKLERNKSLSRLGLCWKNRKISLNSVSLVLINKKESKNINGYKFDYEILKIAKEITGIPKY